MNLAAPLVNIPFLTFIVTAVLGFLPQVRADMFRY